MISKEMLKFISEQGGILLKKYGKGYNKREIIMARMIKLNEEVGELSSEVLASFGQQRQRTKKDRYNRKSLKGEFADVIITTLLLAKSLDINVNESIKNKINKLKKRYE